MRPVFAICDLETDYAIRFMEYLNRRALPFEVQMFTSTPPLLAYGKQKHISLLLISERAMCEDVRALQVDKLVLLSEEREDGEEEFPTIYKYQAAAHVVREVLDCYSAQQRLADEPVHLQSSGQIIGVYGFTDPLTQRLFTLTYGQLLAEHRRVLYLNLQKYSGLQQMTEEQTGGDLSDLLYLFRTGQEGFSFRASGILGRIGALEYLPVPYYSEDIGEMSGEEWLSFFEKLQLFCGHDLLLLDLSDAVRALPTILKQCSRRLLLTRETVVHGRQRSLLEKEWELDDLRETWWLTPPVVDDPRQGRWYLESLPQSVMGAYIRKQAGLL